MSERSKFIPLPEIESDKVNFDIPLPEWVESEKIGVNLRKIHQLIRVAGIAHLAVVGEDGETTSVMPTMIGSDEKGQAIAGMIGAVKKVPTHTEQHRSSERSLPSSGWRDVTLTVNMSEVTDRILRSKRNKSLRSVDNWATHLNEAVKSGILSEGMDNLLMLSKVQLISALVFNPYVIGFDILTGGNPLYDLLFWGPVYNGGLILLEKSRGVKVKDAKLFSFIVGPQLDRALALKLLAIPSRLIKTTTK